MARMALSALLFIVTGLMTPAFVEAGEYNPVLSVGDAAPAWKELPGVDGKKHSLADLEKYDVVVLVFTCNSCPYAIDYEERIMNMAKSYADKSVVLVAINVNKVPEDSLEKMQERAKLKKFNFSYLYDDSQQIAKDYGATYTPEFFVLNKERKLAYMGGFDDSSAIAKVKKKYLADALDAVLAGRAPAVKETVAIGCRVRFERSRRRKPE
ncbi:MAG: peroxiredoxin [Pirellulaceae bacterium]|jgi:peroxiredoxin